MAGLEDIGRNAYDKGLNNQRIRRGQEPEKGGSPNTAFRMVFVYRGRYNFGGQIWLITQLLLLEFSKAKKGFVCF